MSVMVVQHTPTNDMSNDIAYNTVYDIACNIACDIAHTIACDIHTERKKNDHCKYEML